MITMITKQVLVLTCSYLNKIWLKMFIKTMSTRNVIIDLDLFSWFSYTQLEKFVGCFPNMI